MQLAYRIVNVVIAPLSLRRCLLSATLSALPNPSANASTFFCAIAPHLFCWLLCCPVASLRLSAGAPSSLHASPFVGCQVASRHIVWHLGLPSSASRCAPLVWLVVVLCCLAPRPLSPSYCRAQNAAVVVINIVAIGSSGSIITIAVTPSLSPPPLPLPSSSTLKGGRGGAGSRSSFEGGWDKKKLLSFKINFCASVVSVRASPNTVASRAKF
jgi:hypothetical protein